MKFRERLMLFCTGLLCVACLVVFVRYGTYQYLIRNLGWDNAWTRTIFADNASLQHWSPPRNAAPDEVPIDWAAKYPYPPAPSETPRPESRLERAERNVHEQTHAFASWTDERFLANRRTAELLHAYLRATGWNIAVLNDASSNNFQYDDGRFSCLLTRQDVRRFADATSDLAAFCKERGIHFVVFLVPWKFASSSPYNGTLDFSNANSDTFLARLHERNVDAIDLRIPIQEAGFSYDDLFMKTDHHWTLATARWAMASVLGPYLNEHYGYHADLSLLDASRFHDERYPNWLLGFHGIKLTLSSAKPEDFYLAYPAYPTAFHLSIPSMKLDSEGDFSIFYDMTQMKPTPYDAYAYHTYAYGDRSLITIENKKQQDGKHLLLLHDSYGAAATPFLALTTERLDSIDPRNFTGSLHTYIEREHPDTVVLFYGAIEFNICDLIHYPRHIFDFR